ncbi:hypothetical protein H2198_001413 [Neophaeococcomyces mojaviensis]|uniref:Uncharacterized protein n=1 Tax=Neophaeococcomyces mojaviensis TaxID=3383035 RepID=A0ACC3AGT2_9EURO|nr:hypothetical protein H2198_001413 [Knufia sp. JES_112]
MSTVEAVLQTRTEKLKRPAATRSKTVQRTDTVLQGEVKIIATLQEIYTTQIRKINVNVDSDEM